MVKNETLEKLVETGQIESVDYYHDVSNSVRPLLDYLTYDVIKSISERIKETKEIWYEENKNSYLSLGWCGNEYLLAVNSYLAEVENKKTTSWTSK